MRTSRAAEIDTAKLCKACRGVFAALFPKYTAEELKDLTADIKTNGLRSEIVLFDGQILDGVNRWEACKAFNIFKPEMFKEYEGPDPTAFVISANDIGQRAMIAAELATMQLGERVEPFAK